MWNINCKTIQPSGCKQSKNKLLFKKKKKNRTGDGRWWRLNTFLVKMPFHKKKHTLQWNSWLKSNKVCATKSWRWRTQLIFTIILVGFARIIFRSALNDRFMTSERQLLQKLIENRSLILTYPDYLCWESLKFLYCILHR